MKITLAGIVTCMLLLWSKAPAHAQEFDWWVNKHGWDGCTHWTNYMNVSPAYFGPNALPVPDVRNACLENQWSVELRPEIHYNKGDFTTDLFARVFAPLGKRASFEVFIVPVEYYNISDTNIRDERFIRTQDASGIAGGDFWIGTHIQLLEKHEKWPDLQLSVYLKTASGNQLVDARYTDTPGYTFLLSTGKYIYGDEKAMNSFRWYAHLGTFIWQTYNDLHFQDDALSYGLGAFWKHNKWFVKAECAGYVGYLGNGDQPVRARLELGMTQQKTDYSLRYAYGIHDFPYQTFALSLKRRFTIQKTVE